MRWKPYALVLAAGLAFALAACGNDAGDSAGAGTQERTPAATVPGKLDQATLDRYLQAAKAIRELGASAQAEMDGSSTDLGRAATGLKYSAEFAAKVKECGLSWDEFLRVHTAVMMALGARGAAQAKAEAEKNLEASRAMLPPEQFEAMKKRMMSSLEAMGNVPPEDVALVERNEDRIKAAWEMK